LLACADPAAAPQHDADATTLEARDTVEVMHDVVPDTRDVIPPDSVGDTGPDTRDTTTTFETRAPEPDIVTAPTLCTATEACNHALLDDGRCPGECFDNGGVTRCSGPVVHALCNGVEATPNAPVAAALFTITPLGWPDVAIVGERYAVSLRLDNTTEAELIVPFDVWSRSVFEVESATWLGRDRVTVPARGSVTLEATLVAVASNALAIEDVVFTIYFREDDPPLVLHSRVAPAEGVDCGGQRFPVNPNVPAVCCDAVFYPGADCCSDDDCAGACVDGRCVDVAPTYLDANTLPRGNQLVRLVLVDSHVALGDPCVNHAGDLKHALELGLAETWYDATSERRVGRDLLAFDWVVTGGVASSDFISGTTLAREYATALDAWLTAAGCPLFGPYDKVIVVAPQGALGLTARATYVAPGLIASTTTELAWLFTHELAHSFGANDRYLDAGGSFQWRDALMSAELDDGSVLPTDDVAWGEMGYGDVDRNGVVDIVEYAAFPESLHVANLSATREGNGVIVRWEVVGREAGVDRHVLVRDLTANGNPIATLNRYKSLRVTATTPTLRVQATYTFTDRDWVRRTLTLDETLPVPTE
jgi:hypothetical protein